MNKFDYAIKILKDKIILDKQVFMSHQAQYGADRVYEAIKENIKELEVAIKILKEMTGLKYIVTYEELEKLVENYDEEKHAIGNYILHFLDSKEKILKESEDNNDD